MTMKIKSITCPSCGSSLNADENETRVVCSFCGCSVIVEDTRQEGYNFELGSMQARANVAQQLANKIDEMIGPLCDYPRVSLETETLKKQRQSLLKQKVICERYGKIITYAVGTLFSLILLLILVAVDAPIPVFLIFGVIAAASFFIASFIVVQYGENVSQGAEDSQLAIEAHEKTLHNFDEVIKLHPDINIPSQYRNIQAMSFIREALKSQQSQTIEQAILQYDDVLRKQQSIELQQEQVRLQREQIEQTRQAQQPKSVFGVSQPSDNQSRGKSIFGSGTQKSGTTVVTRTKKVVVKQHGHSIAIHLFLCCFGIGLLTIPYYTLSPKHYWHL